MFLEMQGGLPIVVDEQVVGGIGASFDTPETRYSHRSGRARGTLGGVLDVFVFGTIYQSLSDLPQLIPETAAAASASDRGIRDPAENGGAPRSATS